RGPIVNWIWRRGSAGPVGEGGGGGPTWAGTRSGMGEGASTSGDANRASPVATTSCGPATWRDVSRPFASVTVRIAPPGASSRRSTVPPGQLQGRPSCAVASTSASRASRHAPSNADAPSPSRTGSQVRACTEGPYPSTPTAVSKATNGAPGSPPRPDSRLCIISLFFTQKRCELQRKAVRNLPALSDSLGKDARFVKRRAQDGERGNFA